MKKILLLITLFACTGILGYSQGIFKPVPSDLFTSGTYYVKQAKNTHVWLPRLSAGVVANQFTYNKTTGNLDMSSFTKVGLGISYAHFVPGETEPYNDYSFNGFIFLPTKEPESGLALALTVSALKYINAGMGYDFGPNKFFLLTGLTYTF